MAYEIVLKDNEVTYTDSDLFEVDVVFEKCTKELLQDKLAYWKSIVYYDPDQIRKEEEDFLKRNHELNKPRRYERNRSKTK